MSKRNKPMSLEWKVIEKYKDIPRTPPLHTIYTHAHVIKLDEIHSSHINMK